MTANEKASQQDEFSITQSLLIDIIDVFNVSCATCDSEILLQDSGCNSTTRRIFYGSTTKNDYCYNE